MYIYICRYIPILSHERTSPIWRDATERGLVARAHLSDMERRYRAPADGRTSSPLRYGETIPSGVGRTSSPLRYGETIIPSTIYIYIMYIYIYIYIHPSTKTFFFFF